MFPDHPDGGVLRSISCQIIGRGGILVAATSCLFCYPAAFRFLSADVRYSAEISFLPFYRIKTLFQMFFIRRNIYRWRIPDGREDVFANLMEEQLFCKNVLRIPFFYMKILCVSFEINYIMLNPQDSAIKNHRSFSYVA